MIYNLEWLVSFAKCPIRLIQGAIFLFKEIWQEHLCHFLYKRGAWRCSSTPHRGVDMHTLIPLLLACFGVALSLGDPVLLTVKKVNTYCHYESLENIDDAAVWHAHEFELNFSH